MSTFQMHSKAFYSHVSHSPTLAQWGGPLLPALPVGVVSGGLGTLVGVGGALFMVPLTQRLCAVPPLHHS